MPRSTLPKPAHSPADMNFRRVGDSTLVSAPGAGVYVKRDDGDHYDRIGVQGNSVYALTVGKRADGTATLVAGTDTETPLPSGPNVDPEWGSNGAEGSWGTLVRQVAASPSDPRVLWKIRVDATFAFRLSRSTDGGSSWSEVSDGADTPTALMVHPATASASSRTTANGLAP